MSMSVGLQEGVAFDLKTSDVNGQPVLNIVMSQPGDPDAEFDFESASTEGATTETTQVTVWALKKQGYEDGQMVDTRSPNSIMADYKNKTAQLTAILGLFTNPTSLSWSPFEGLDINTDSIRTNPKLLQDDDVLAVMSRNIFQQAVNYFKEFGNTTDTFRVPLIRTSKAKNTPKLRDKQLDKNPIAEPMSVPVEESKVGYTKYEIDNNLNSPDPVASDTDGKDNSVNDTFGGVPDPKGVPSNL